MRNIAVIGAGSWGTALALLLARNHVPVTLWGNVRAEMETLCRERENRFYLPGFSFPPLLKPCVELSEALESTSDVLIVVPSQAFRSVLQAIQAEKGNTCRIAWGTKGVDPTTKKLLHELVAEVLGAETPAAVLSGPSFAKEVAQDLPTAVSLASNNAAFAEDLIARLHTRNFHPFKNEDMIGVQLGGVIKNVLAIAAGISDGLGFGTNARCALITRGIHEMGRLCVAMGGQHDTMLGLAGLGDLVLTCSDNQSRNRRFGLALGQGQSAPVVLTSIGQSVEGYYNARQIYELAHDHHIDMPIAKQVYRVLYEGHSVQHAVDELLDRPPGEE
ncbi:MAG TPA: NAD(P)H-dependent glycerol-3-phosphate dehydrogenase [Coxiellaceae bacterium]|nr:NAD(P)H-dependent glycerol-3-phosphate dehydrogenase [Coxiellaceae bacterium]